MDKAAAVEQSMVSTMPIPPVNPLNQKYPEIITVTESNERTEATEEHKLNYESGPPKGTILVKKISVIHTTIRTTTPYTGTV